MSYDAMRAELTARRTGLVNELEGIDQVLAGLDKLDGKASNAAPAKTGPRLERSTPAAGSSSKEDQKFAEARRLVVEEGYSVGKAAAAAKVPAHKAYYRNTREDWPAARKKYLREHKSSATEED